MAAEIGDEERNELYQLFCSLDADGGGQLELQELQQLFDSMGIKMEEEKLKEMFAEVDESGDGSIDFDEFLHIKAMEMPLDPLAEARRAFDLFDKDGSGSIDAGELKDALRAMGQNALGRNVNDGEVEQLLKAADEDGGGEIDFDEFCDLI
ncbi:hypothetical protein GUITHDRAFT_39668, partial [Guillardia theta CCMP2712]